MTFGSQLTIQIRHPNRPPSPKPRHFLHLTSTSRTTTAISDSAHLVGSAAPASSPSRHRRPAALRRSCGCLSTFSTVQQVVQWRSVHSSSDSFIFEVSRRNDPALVSKRSQFRLAEGLVSVEDSKIRVAQRKFLSVSRRLTTLARKKHFLSHQQ